jgi:endonuclease YncB( thermonuclease family)
MGNLCGRTIPKNINPRDIDRFVPPINGGRVIKVYDGDTITIASYLPYRKSKLYKFSVRLNGIDCPELKTKNRDEKEVATIAKEFVSDMVLGSMVKLEKVSLEKYGRVLANVIYNKKSISQLLLQERLAVPYDGGTKLCPKNWKKFRLNGNMN